jgi:hypothetical protein
VHTFLVAKAREESLADLLEETGYLIKSRQIQWVVDTSPTSKIARG